MDENLNAKLKARLAAANRRKTGSGEVLPRRPAGLAHPPLSSGQSRLWYLAQVEPESAVYNVVEAHRMSGDLDHSALERALDAIIATHEILRTRLRVVNGEPVQDIVPHTRFTLPLEDWSASGEAVLKAAVSEAVMKPFDLDEGPLFRARLYRSGPRAHVLLLVFHHSIVDGISVDRVMHDAGRLYAAPRAGHEEVCEPDAVQYGDYAVWQRGWLQGDEARKQLEFWVEQHGGCDTPLNLPTDMPRPGQQSSRGGAVRRRLDGAPLAAFDALLKESKSSTFMGLLAVLAALLQRYTQQDECNIAVPASGRGHPSLQRTIGYFANTLVFHLKTDPERTFAEHLDATRTLCLEGFRRQDIPFDRLVSAIDPPRDLSRTPLHQVFMGYRDKRGDAPDFGDITVAPFETDIRVARTDLTLWFERDGDCLSMVLEYCTDLFEAATAERFLDHFGNLLATAVVHPREPLGSLDFLSAADLAAQLEANDTACQFPHDDALTLIEASGARHADAVAVIAGGHETTYRALLRDAARVQLLLEQRGLEPGDLVGIHMRRSARMIAAILGAWRAGCAYVPLDPAFPPARLAYMLEKAGIHVVLADGEHPGDGFKGVTKLDVDTLPETAAEAPATGTAPLAYTMFTSGSTGKPKGVQVPRSAVANFLQSMALRPGFGPGNRILAVTTLSFDISVLEMLLPLATGGSVVIAPKEQAEDAIQLARLIEAHGVDTLQATPATWKMLLAEDWRPSRAGFRALCGGEAMPETLARELVAAGCELWNMYGPTETTIWSTCERIAADTAPIALGEPIHNTRCYVLDEQRRLCPIGVRGELCIAGAGVATGYLGEAALTAERFVDVEMRDGRARVYRTGDVVVRTADGRLLYKGRNDHQVKLRGFRIEIGDIENSLVQVPGIEEAAALVKPFGDGDSRLLAFVRFANGVQIPTTELRRKLAQFLPTYMIPQQFIVVGEMPLTANGKVDRKALLDIGGGHVETRFVAPATPAEETVARIWCEILKVDKVSTDRGFFDVGGHSLLSIEAIRAMEEAFGMRVGPRDMMLSTLQQIAATLTRGPARAAEGERRAAATADERTRLTRVRDFLSNRLRAPG